MAAPKSTMLSKPRIYGAGDMSVEDFLVWLKGVTDMLGDQPPSAEQWAKLREVAETVTGRLVADKMIRNQVYDESLRRPPRQEIDYHIALEKLKMINEMVQSAEPRRIDAVGVAHGTGKIALPL
jgi:hypothetical protein